MQKGSGYPVSMSRFSVLVADAVSSVTVVHLFCRLEAELDSGKAARYVDEGNDVAVKSEMDGRLDSPSKIEGYDCASVAGCCWKTLVSTCLWVRLLGQMLFLRTLVGSMAMCLLLLSVSPGDVRDIVICAVPWLCNVKGILSSC
ncbi:hypothetical protein Droror1_Dr00004171 [Drosera rotundifolia]